jgi:hypothetical protein
MIKLRLLLTIILICLSVTDLSLTFYYVSKYRNWQPQKPFNLMENNPLLVFLWNHLGLILGIILGSVIILTMIWFISTDLHWIFTVILLALLIWTMYNHYNNIVLLGKLIEKYPSGYLPEAIFGVVVGNNLNKMEVKNETTIKKQ